MERHIVKQKHPFCLIVHSRLPWPIWRTRGAITQFKAQTQRHRPEHCHVSNKIEEHGIKHGVKVFNWVGWMQGCKENRGDDPFPFWEFNTPWNSMEHLQSDSKCHGNMFFLTGRYTPVASLRSWKNFWLKMKATPLISSTFASAVVFLLMKLAVMAIASLPRNSLRRNPFGEGEQRAKNRVYARWIIRINRISTINIVCLNKEK